MKGIFREGVEYRVSSEAGITWFDGWLIYAINHNSRTERTAAINPRSHYAAKFQKMSHRATRIGNKAHVTPAILWRNFVAQVCRVSKLQCATLHVPFCRIKLALHDADTDSPDTLTSLRGSSRGCRCRHRGMRA